jgi:diaminopimelate epimerase
MKIHFYKYQATGNDFVLIDNLAGKHSLSTEQVKSICHRRFGVGADGLMLIEKDEAVDFNLRYFNSDGSQSLCGNGSRAAVTMAACLGLVKGKATFKAFDGIHKAEVAEGGIVRLKMNDVKEIKKIEDGYFINTGSPHVIRFVTGVEHYPVVENGREIRYSDAFRPGGTNVNFVEIAPDNKVFVRTYERGVEDETLSCGTGVTAAALAASLYHIASPVSVKTLGGDLTVEFRVRQTGQSVAKAGAPSRQGGIFEEIYLVGPAKLVFEGDLEL